MRVCVCVCYVCVHERQEDKGVISQQLFQTRQWTQLAVIPPVSGQETLSHTVSDTVQEITHTHTHTRAHAHLYCRVRPGGLHQELGIASGEALSCAGCWRCTWTYAVNSGERQFVVAKDKTANK